MPTLIKFILIFIIFLGIIVGVEAFLPFLGNQQFQKISQSPLIKELNQNQHQETAYKEFSTSDKKLKIEYSSDWIKIEEGLEKVIPEEYIKKYDIQLPFLAFKMGEEKPPQLTVMKMTIGSEEGFNKVLEILKEINNRKGWTIEVTKKIKQNGTITIETKYQKPNQPDMRAKEKVLFLKPQNIKKEVYIVTLSSLLANWKNFEKEAEEIINSVQLVK